MKIACSDALWNTVLKWMYLQQKASHQMHCACWFVGKVIMCDARGPSPNDPLDGPPRIYATDNFQGCTNDQGVPAANFAKVYRSVFEISCLKNRLQTDGQTHRHDRVHNQPPPDGWRMIIKYSRVKGKVNANEKLKTSNARIPTSSYALWKGLWNRNV